MLDFLSSVSPFGWIVIAAALFGMATLPRAAAEAWRRPWKGRRDALKSSPKHRGEG